VVTPVVLSPAGSASENDQPGLAPNSFVFVIVKVRVEVPPVSTGVGAKPMSTWGLASTSLTLSKATSLPVPLGCSFTNRMPAWSPAKSTAPLLVKVPTRAPPIVVVVSTHASIGRVNAGVAWSPSSR